MRTLSQKPKSTQKTKSDKSTKPSWAHCLRSRDVRSILHLQKMIGNQAVLELLKARTEYSAASSFSDSLSGIAHDFSRIPMHASRRCNIQLKLKVNASGDKYEQEANRVAEQVLRQEITEEEEDQKEKIQAKASQQIENGGLELDVDPNNWLSHSEGGGSPLSHTIQTFLEPRLLHDSKDIVEEAASDDLISPALAGDPLLEAIYDSEELLMKGSKGPAVVKVQSLLMKLGYELPEYRADGDFGNETEKAVKTFQSDNGLAIDGIVGPNTIGALDVAALSAGSAVAPKTEEEVEEYPAADSEIDLEKAKEQNKVQNRLLGFKNRIEWPEAESVGSADFAYRTEAFQKERGIEPADGIMGPDTWTVRGEELGIDVPKELAQWAKSRPFLTELEASTTDFIGSALKQLEAYLSPKVHPERLHQLLELALGQLEAEWERYGSKVTGDTVKVKVRGDTKSGDYSISLYISYDEPGTGKDIEEQKKDPSCDIQFQFEIRETLRALGYSDEEIEKQIEFICTPPGQRTSFGVLKLSADWGQDINQVKAAVEDLNQQFRNFNVVYGEGIYGLYKVHSSYYIAKNTITMARWMLSKWSMLKSKYMRGDYPFREPQRGEWPNKYFELMLRQYKTQFKMEIQIMEPPIEGEKKQEIFYKWFNMATDLRTLPFEADRALLWELYSNR